MQIDSNQNSVKKRVSVLEVINGDILTKQADRIEGVLESQKLIMP
jgi:hypothetical protein